ncbi:MAG TPA: FHA domain-containing protein [Steroidobacteraceae bacterium]|jgi:chromosome segregation ATPase|nr:FHA domain-containing protein [Steroidobacteraceae bacterium]
MDPRPRQPAQELPPPGADLDSTDQLPVLDPTAYEAAARERLADTWVQPVLPQAETASETRGGAEDPLQTAAANLREAQELLAKRAARLTELERALEEARGAHAVAERRAGDLGDELSQARAAAEKRETQLNAEQAEARAAVERRSSEHAAQLAAVRAAAEKRDAELNEELTRARAALGQQAGELADELGRTRRAAEAREAEQARQLAEEKAAAERRLAEERAVADLAQRDRDLENQQTLAARERALAALSRELEEIRTRAASFFESLTSAERRRSLLEGLVSDLQHEAAVQETVRERLARELAGRDTQAGELESELAQRATRIAALEGQLATLRATLEQRDAELMRMHAAHASTNTALEGARAATATASSRATEHETALTETRTRIATREAELAAERKRLAEREQELAMVRADMEQWAGALRAAQLERSGHLASIAAGESRVKQLEERVAEQSETLHTLQSASDAALARAQELEGDLRAAEDGITRLESQLRARNTRVSELEKANQQWRTTLEETRHTDTGTHHVPHDVDHAHFADSAAAREAAPDGATRLLIQSSGEREVVHVLARKTSIGRTPDNDLQIDAKYISRHHAVILAGPAHTIIEDLNSTNGVLVNGRRISRQTLKDGDQVTIGRSQYRFAVRRTGEKR